ncbi:hypothetical protein Tmel_1460 [Thermosipho melanesiensis BI429]|uniref:Uncharacterized protein n=2 Tax=Thermosipho melanesiensis TaxID=46541 RepID=A6LN06_THEM4|nr:hypothetical protein Tmel_1460 [Thermosipho melanesiensis BI429]
MLVTGEMRQKTFNWIKLQIEAQVDEYIKEFKKYLDKETLSIFNLSSKVAHESINVPFRGVPTNVMVWFNNNFMNFEDTIMKNYAGDLMRKIENTITAGIISGTPTDVIAKMLIKEIPPNAKRRVQVMVRDQLGLAMQHGIWQTYQEYQDVIKAYKWSGPQDKRTTKWCENRYKLTQKKPWTYEQIQKYIQTNPKKLKGKEIRADHGTFLHPHIQCRHRLLAIPESPKVVVNEAIKEVLRAR